MGARGRSNKRRKAAAEDDDEFNPTTPAAKRHITCDERGATRHASADDHKPPTEVIDLEPDAVPRKLVLLDDEFAFQQGSIYVELIEGDSSRNYIFKEDVFERSSERLTKLLGFRIREADPGLANAIKQRCQLEFLFNLQYYPTQDAWLLQRNTFTILNSPIKEELQTSTPLQSASTPTLAEVPNLQLPATPKSLYSPRQLDVLLTADSLPPNAMAATVKAYDSLTAIPELLSLEKTSNVLITGDENYAPEPAEPAIIVTREPWSKGDAKGIQVEENELEPKQDETEPAMEEQNKESGVATIEADVVVDSPTATELTTSTQKKVIKSVMTISESDVTDPKQAMKEKVHDASMAGAVSVLPESSEAVNERVSDSVTAPTDPVTNSSMQNQSGNLTTQAPKSTPAATINNTAQLTSDSSLLYGHGKIRSISTASKEKISKVVVNSKEGRLAAVEAHHHIFRIFRNKTPDLDTNNINNAFMQIDMIIRTAYSYNCVAVVRHRLTNHILQFGQDLFKAILEDPPRWLWLSTRLNCALIFREAMIHLVGYYPHDPWKKTKNSRIPDSTLSLIHKKVEELRSSRASVDLELFNSSICVNGELLTFHNLDKSNFGTWFVVQLWQDWFRKSMCNHDTAKYSVGDTYRLMAKGGDAYLNSYAVYQSLQAYKGKNFGSWNLKQVQEDLEIMKAFAQKKVKHLVVNHSMIDVEHSGVQHLTGTKIRDDELPWFTNED